MRPPRARLALPLLVLAILLALPAAGAGAAPRHRHKARQQAPLRVSVDPALFSPNGDGHIEETTIRVEVDLPSTVDIQIRDGSGTVHRSWTVPASPESPASVTWDGRGDGGVVPDGGYEVRARDADPLGLNGEGASHVALDTRGPGFTWRGASAGGTRVRFRFKAEDPSGPVGVIAETQDAAGPIGSAEGLLDPPGGSISWRSGRLMPGNYTTRFRISDAVGNVHHAGPFAWRLERSMPGRVWTRVPGSGARVALTIDDCHFAGAWASMLSTLDERDAGATFFCPGTEMLEDPGLVRRTIREGHVIGSHGWDHGNMTRMSPDGVAHRVRADANALWRIAKRTTAPYMRPPEGAYTRSTIAASGQAGHPRVILWDVDTRDWTSPGVSSIVSRAVQGAERGSIILLHTKPQSAAALPAIISGLRSRGLEPVGLPELFRAAGSGG